MGGGGDGVGGGGAIDGGSATGLVVAHITKPPYVMEWSDRQVIVLPEAMATLDGPLEPLYRERPIVM